MILLIVILKALLALLATVAALAIGILIFAHRTAKGESDVNGDPERDAGLTGEQMGRMFQNGEIKFVCSWCDTFISGNPYGKIINHVCCDNCVRVMRQEIENLERQRTETTSATLAEVETPSATVPNR